MIVQMAYWGGYYGFDWEKVSTAVSLTNQK